MPEWSIGPVSKSGDCHRSEGSNPSLSLKQERGLMASFLFHRAMVRTLGEGSTKSAENEVNKADFGITAKGRNLEGKGRAPRGLCPIPLSPSISLPLSYTLGERFSFHIKKTTGLYRTPIKKESFYCVEAS